MKSVLTITLLVSVCGIVQGQDRSSNSVLTPGTEPTAVLGGWPKKVRLGRSSSAQDAFSPNARIPQSQSITKKAGDFLAQSKGSTIKLDSVNLVKPNATLPRKGSTSQKFLLPAPKVDDPKPVPSLLQSTSSLSLPPLPTANQRQQPRSRPERTRKRVYSSYTLGPGDMVTFATFDRADLEKTVQIGPDGRVSYLQAIAVNAQGLTVDQLRAKMELELQQYRKNFKLIINPQELQSKEYAVLGRVRSPGTFPLDRPTTVLDGIASAEGVEVGTIRGTTNGLADFERSFVSRNGKKLGVDLSKLYFEGDFTQNVLLQPNDYLYIASILKREFHILGEVVNPGKIKIPNQITVAQAISLAGGFRENAYRAKVLIIRGDLEKPEAHLVNVRDVLKGKGTEMYINSRDIVFVSRRPFTLLSDAIEQGIDTYVQTLTAEAFNQNFNPISL